MFIIIVYNLFRQNVSFIFIGQLSVVNMRLYSAFVSSLLFPTKSHRSVLTPLKDNLPFKQAENNATIVFIPGCGVSPLRYNPVLENIRTCCEQKNMNTDIFIAKFTGNLAHRFEINTVASSIKKQFGNNTENLIVMGHSAGGSVCIEIAEKIKARGMILWDSCFNSAGRLPWKSYVSYKYNVSSLTLLSEYDKFIPFTVAALEYCEHKENTFDVSVLPRSNHFTGLNGDSESKESLQLSWKVSEYMASLLTTGPRQVNAQYYVSSATNSFIRDFSPLVHKNGQVSKTMEDITGIQNFHYSVCSDMMLTIFYILIPSLRPYLHGLNIFPGFICSHPTTKKSFSYSPMFNFDPFAKFNLPSVWIKLNKGFSRKNQGRDLCIDTYYKAHAELTESQKRKYRVKGKKIVFGDDIEIPHIPGICPLLWIFLPVFIRENDGHMIINCPVIRMDNGNLNAKILSKENFVEWLVSKSLK